MQVDTLMHTTPYSCNKLIISMDLKAILPSTQSVVLCPDSTFSRLQEERWTLV